MADRALLDAAAKAASYVGQKRYWTPYAGAQPVECTAWTCGVTASFKEDGMTVTVGAVWTKYRDTFGRMDQVWFPSEKWETMPQAPSVRACDEGECRAAERDSIICAGECEVASGKRPDGVPPSDEPSSKPVTDSRCNYLAHAGRVCNKCGRIHDGGGSPWPGIIDAAGVAVGVASASGSAPGVPVVLRDHHPNCAYAAMPDQPTNCSCPPRGVGVTDHQTFPCDPPMDGSKAK